MLKSYINEITDAIVVSSNIPVAVSKTISIYVVSSIEQDREDIRELHCNFKEIYEYLRRWSNERYEPVNGMLMELEQYEYERWVIMGHANYKIVEDLINYYKCTQPLRDRLVILFNEADNEMDFNNRHYNHKNPIPTFKSIAAPEMN